MIRVLLSARVSKTAKNLPVEVKAKAEKSISTVAAAFGDLHKHRGLGLRKLGRRSYEIRIHLQWRIVFIHEGENLIAYDVMNHDEVSLWLRGQRK